MKVHADRGGAALECMCDISNSFPMSCMLNTACFMQMALRGDMPQSAETSDTPDEASIDSRQPAGRSPPAEPSEAASQPETALQAGDDPIAAEVNRQLEAGWQRHRASPNCSRCRH